MTYERGICFVCFCHPEPQGSARGFPIQRQNGKMGVSITSDNRKLKPFRQAIAQTAMLAIDTRPFAAKHIPVRMEIDFYFQKPASAPKKRLFPVVKPDADKLARSIFDALTGIVFADDAQVIDCRVRKHYGTPERIEISAEIAESSTEDHPIPTHYESALSDIPF